MQTSPVQLTRRTQWYHDWRTAPTLPLSFWVSCFPPVRYTLGLPYRRQGKHTLRPANEHDLKNQMTEGDLFFPVDNPHTKPTEQKMYREGPHLYRYIIFTHLTLRFKTILPDLNWEYWNIQTETRSSRTKSHYFAPREYDYMSLQQQDKQNIPSSFRWSVRLNGPEDEWLK